MEVGLQLRHAEILSARMLWATTDVYECIHGNYRVSLCTFAKIKQDKIALADFAPLQCVIADVYR